MILTQRKRRLLRTFREAAELTQAALAAEISRRLPNSTQVRGEWTIQRLEAGKIVTIEVAVHDAWIDACGIDASFHVSRKKKTPASNTTQLSFSAIYAPPRRDDIVRPLDVELQEIQQALAVATSKIQVIIDFAKSVRGVE